LGGDVKTHLFEPFFTTKGLGKGTDSDWRRVYGIIARAAGKSGYSEPNSGTTFKIDLPRTDAENRTRNGGRGNRNNCPSGHGNRS